MVSNVTLLIVLKPHSYQCLRTTNSSKSLKCSTQTTIWNNDYQQVQFLLSSDFLTSPKSPTAQTKVKGNILQQKVTWQITNSQHNTTPWVVALNATNIYKTANQHVNNSCWNIQKYVKHPNFLYHIPHQVCDIKLQQNATLDESINVGMNWVLEDSKISRGRTRKTWWQQASKCKTKTVAFETKTKTPGPKTKTRTR